MNSSRIIGRTVVRLIRDDITRQETDAIVNAANSTLMGGGGVDGAIHRAGGPTILEECRAIRLDHGDLLPGEAVLTSGGKLKAQYVIHTVGPVWQGGNFREEETLGRAYRNCLEIADRHHLATLAFPAISTGAYGFPKERAARIAFETIERFVLKHPAIREIRLVVFSEDDERVYTPFFRTDATANG
jgi:O-acetyl-ADP-ribose deacetylase (regulator of RNase III)